MLFRLFSYLKFLLKSSNQHGVHSPFVYAFVTQGLYKKEAINTELKDFNFKGKLSKKEMIILNKIIIYFKPASVITASNSKNTLTNNKYNLLYLNNLSICELKKIHFIYPQSFFVIKNIYQDKTTLKNWLEITQLQKSIVTVNLFYFGLIFFRKEQAKENFIIRV